jgi:hypothetical protein
MDLSKIGYFIPDTTPLLPRDMNKFWDHWNNCKEPISKVVRDDIQGSGANDSKLLFGLPQFDGMIVHFKSDTYLKDSTWKQNVALEPSIWDPFVEDLEEKMPWFETDAIVLWATLRPVAYHMDPAPRFHGPVAIRSLIHDDNPKPMFKVKYPETKEERVVPYSPEQNLFAFNNIDFYHGANYLRGHSKILMRAFGTIKYPELLMKQVKETKEKGFPIWDVSDNA